ncbi:MAG TPA: cytochrome P450 [Acidimicrobiales bacterium]|nr:cytochrome P450 [Acidimicrobiales bacterium]
MTEPPFAIDLLSGDFWASNPQRELAWLRRHDPVYWDAAAGVWGITTYEHVREVSRDPSLFSSAGGARPDSGALPMMIDMDDPAHRDRRRLVSSGFTPRQVRALEDRARTVADTLIDSVCERGECDLVGDVAAWLPLIMIGDALGFEPDDHPTLLQWSDDLLGNLGRPDPAAAERSMTAAAGYHEYISRVIEDRRQRPRDDLISVLVHAEVDGRRLEHENLIFESLLILIGGDETTRHVISGGAYQLLAHPDQWAALRADRTLVTSAVEEMLRWVSPIKIMARTATRDVEFHGRQLGEGDTLVLLYSSANRDEEQFDHPFTFDIARSPNDHVAFGFGPHFCLGNALARLELQVMFEQLVERLPDLALADDREPPHRPNNFVTGYEHLPVVFTPTAPLRN